MTHDNYNSPEAIRRLINDGEVFYIAGHTGPDGDAIGASFGLAMALTQMGKQAKVLLEPYHSKYEIIPGKHLLHEVGDAPLGVPQRVPHGVPQYASKPRDAEGQTYTFAPYENEKFTLICVDCADVQRLSGLAAKLWQTASVTACIDHHYTNTGFAAYNFVDGSASSTCEMIYRLLDGFAEITPEIAAALYAGMVCDTGGFRFLATSPQTLTIAANLVAKNIPFNEIYTELVHLHTYTEVKLHARVMESCRRTDVKPGDGSIVYALVPRSMFQNLKDASDATGADLEGMVEYLLNIRGAKVSLLVYARDNGEIKVSLRSKSINVGSIATQLGGGGHFQAAGATIADSADIEEVAERVLKLIKAEFASA